jgi:HD-GYP domain-containing protein (c-di-GMP phosphodiesterase class II)
MSLAQPPVTQASSRVAIVSKLIEELVVTTIARRVYDANHPRVQAAVTAAHAALQEATTVAGVLEILLIDRYLVLDAKPLIDASMAASRLMASLDAMQAGGFRFTENATITDVLGLVDLLAKPTGSLHDADAQLRRQNAHDVQLLARSTTTEVTDAGEQCVSVPMSVFQATIDFLQETSVRVARRDHFSIDDASGAIERILRQIDSGEDRTLGLPRYERYDAFTFGHSFRVCFLALNFARHLTRDENLVQRIGTAALLHDIGKAWIPFEILHASGRLNAEERREMEKHSTYGGEILLETKSPDPAYIASAIGHHRSLDGHGYPRMSSRVDPSLTTRIVKICDVFEALTAERPYKRALSPVRAYKIMYGMRSSFGENLLRRFIDCTGIYLPGTRVKLDTGEIAEVVGQTGIFESPRVEVLVDAQGEPLPHEARCALDLSTAGIKVHERIES